MRKAQGLPITTIIIAALGILVLIVIGGIFRGQISQFTRVANECPGRCYKLNPPLNAPFGLYGDTPCDAQFETRLSGSHVPRNMPKTDTPSEWVCDQCCILTG